MRSQILNISPEDGGSMFLRNDVYLQSHGKYKSCLKQGAEKIIWMYRGLRVRKLEKTASRGASSVVVFTQNYNNDQIKNRAGHVAPLGEMRNASTILVGNSEGKRKDIETVQGNMAGGCGLD
jgi:hypothetical protein